MRRPDPAVLRLLVFVGGLVAILATLILLRRVVFPLLLGFAIAYVLNPAVGWFERHGRSRTFGAAMLAAGTILVIALVVLLVIPAVADQVDHLSQRMPQYGAELRGHFEPWLNRLADRYPTQFDIAKERARAFLDENLPRLAQSLARQLAQLFSSFLGLLLFLLNLVFVPVFAFYLLVDLPKLKSGLRGLVPLPYRATVLQRLGEVDEALSSFVRGQLTIAIILGLINAIGLSLLGVPLGFVIGIVAGMANMIPYMALVVGLVPALALCWVEHQSLALLLGVVAVFTGAQMLEGLVLSPKILGRSVQLHPVWVLLAVIVGGSLFGFFGMLLAVPAAAVIQVFVRSWLTLYQDSRLYRGDASDVEEGAEGEV
jgi:predicted PurR-regulated permease PerM